MRVTTFFKELLFWVKYGWIFVLFYPVRKLTPFTAYAALLILKRRGGVYNTLMYWYVYLYYKLIKL